MEPGWITVIAAIVAAFAVLSILSGERGRQVQNAAVLRQNSKLARAASDPTAAASTGPSSPAKPPAR